MNTHPVHPARSAELANPGKRHWKQNTTTAAMRQCRTTYAGIRLTNSQESVEAAPFTGAIRTIDRTRSVLGWYGHLHFTSESSGTVPAIRG